MPDRHQAELDLLKEWLLDYENLSAVPADDRQCHPRHHSRQCFEGNLQYDRANRVRGDLPRPDNAAL